MICSEESFTVKILIIKYNFCNPMLVSCSFQFKKYIYSSNSNYNLDFFSFKVNQHIHSSICLSIVYTFNKN